MLKSVGMNKLAIPIIVLLLGIGIVLTGIGFAMEGNADYLKENGEHKWYQIIYMDEDDQLKLGIHLGNITILGNQ